MKYIFLVAILATALITSLTVTNHEIFAAKPDNKPQKCQVKVQVKVLNAVNGTTYTAEVGDLQAQSKIAEESTVAFNFQYKKGGSACPEKGSTVEGNVNGEAFAVLINSLTKPNKIGIELSQ